MEQDIYLYPGSQSEAHRLGEAALWDASFHANVSCARDIEAVIRVYGDGRSALKPEASQMVLKRWGFKRTNFVLANTIERLGPYKEQLSAENQEWQKKAYVPPDDAHNRYFEVDTALAYLDAFISQVREAYGKLELFGPEHCEPNSYESLDYCKNLAPEQPAPSLSAERKEEIISGILNYMAEYFDDSSLYDILHNTLEICNDEIGCLGFALYDEYVDEQIEASEVQSDLLPKSGKLVNLLSAYEELQQIPDEERITRLAPGAFGYCLDPNVPDERLHTAYQQALSALELESDEIQEAESFTSRDEIISRMRDCLLAKELTAGDKVLFVATEPYGGPGDFDLRGGVIESVDEKDKTCSVRGTFFTMEKVPLHYVLGRYNPAVGEEHYGVRGIVPFFCEDKELAGYYLNEVRTMWDVEMGEEQDLSM